MAIVLTRDMSPAFGAPVRTEHPHRHDLLAAFLGNEVNGPAYDVINRNLLTFGGGYLDGYTITSTDFITLGADWYADLANGLPAVTFATRFRYTSLSSSDNDNTLLNWFSSSGNNLAIVFTESSGGNFRVGARSRSSDGFQDVTSNYAPIENAWVSMVGIYNFALDDIALYINGKHDNTAGVSFGSTTLDGGGSSTDDTLGATGGREMTGDIDYFYLFSGAKHSIAQELHIDPYAMFRRPRFISSVKDVSGGGSPGTVPPLSMYYARQRNTQCF